MQTKTSSTDNSDIIVRLILLKGLESAALWLSAPRPELGGLTPEDALERGCRADVERLISIPEEFERLAS